MGNFSDVIVGWTVVDPSRHGAENAKCTTEDVLAAIVTAATPEVASAYAGAGEPVAGYLPQVLRLDRAAQHACWR